jgi:hypothetical protein
MRNSAEVSPGKRPIKLGAPAITTNVRSRRFVVRIRFGARRATADGDERVEIALNEPPSPTDRRPDGRRQSPQALGVPPPPRRLRGRPSTATAANASSSSARNRSLRGCSRRAGVPPSPRLVGQSEDYARLTFPPDIGTAPACRPPAAVDTRLSTHVPGFRHARTFAATEKILASARLPPRAAVR